MSKDLEFVLWMCNYWAQRAFARDENSQMGWMYLYMAECVRDEMTGGQNV